MNTDDRWCKECLKNDLKTKFAKTSGNEKINKFIQDMQEKINDPTDIIFEWVPYDQFNNIKEIGKGGFATVYSAIWKDGPLHYNEKEYSRNQNTQIIKLL